MKRRELILVVSLELFNREGEASLTAVDIANELDISPGNLYYHFKGKEELVAELFERYEDGMKALLHNPIDTQDSLEDNWLKFYLVFEHIYHYRFFYRNLSDIALKYPVITNRLRRLIDLKYDFIAQLLDALVEDGVFEERSIAAIGTEELANSILLIMTNWVSYQRLRKQQMNQHGFIQSAILQIMALLAPYMGDIQRQFMERCHALYQQENIEE